MMDVRRVPTVQGSALAMLVGMVVIGCSGGGTPSAVAEAPSAATSAPTATAAPTPTSAPTPSPAPTPTAEPTPDLAAIGAAYLAIADVFATRGQPAVDAIAQGGSYTPEEWGAMHQTVADIYDEVLVELDKIAFPADLSDEAAEIRAHWVEARDLFAEVAADPSKDNWDEFVETAQAYGKVGDAIRAYLGLPPRPTPPSD